MLTCWEECIVALATAGNPKRTSPRDDRSGGKTKSFEDDAALNPTGIRAKW